MMYTYIYNYLYHGTETTSVLLNQGGETKPIYHHQRVPSVSISLPPSPVGVNIRKVLFSRNTIFADGIPDSSGVSGTASGKPPKQPQHHSEPIPTAAAYNEAIGGGQFSYHQSIPRLKDKRFDSFKTWSGKFERQITLLRGKSPLEAGTGDETVPNREVEKNLPVDRYFDALEGPELDTLKVCVSLPPPLCTF
jgi:hypothetical protein